jgi:hypothetical protein
VGWIAAIALVAIAAAVFFSRPEILQQASVQLEDVLDSASQGGSVAYEDIQIAGIRTVYDEQYRPRVRVLVINHADAPSQVGDIEVQMRPRGADPEGEPLAKFVVRLDKDLEPNEAREIETELQALGTLASLPRWNEVRLNVVSLSGQEPAASTP